MRVLPFVAGVAALAGALASADAFVHAGDQETFGLSALEAMACGTPIVVRKAEGLAELADGRCGLAVEQGSGVEFAEAIAALFEGDRSAQRAAARARAEAGDWERILPDLLGHYQRLIGSDAMTALPAGPPLEAAALPPSR